MKILSRAGRLGQSIDDARVRGVVQEAGAQRGDGGCDSVPEGVQGSRSVLEGGGAPLLYPAVIGARRIVQPVCAGCEATDVQCDEEQPEVGIELIVEDEVEVELEERLSRETRCVSQDAQCVAVREQSP